MSSILSGLSKFYEDFGGKSLPFTKQDIFNPSQQKFGTFEQMEFILKLVLGLAMHCDQRQEVISIITTQMDEEAMEDLHIILQHITELYLPHLVEALNKSINSSNATPIDNEKLQSSNNDTSQNNSFFASNLKDQKFVSTFNLNESGNNSAIMQYT